MRLQNVAASDGPNELILNSIFHNTKNHEFLKTAIMMFNSTFRNGEWASSGPFLFTKAFKELCRQEFTEKGMKNAGYTRNDCFGMTMLEPKSFYPFDWFHAEELNVENHKDDYWDNKFKQSFAVHFYASSSRGRFMGVGFPSISHPNFYGLKKPALAYLGPKECPTSFYSTKKI